jgi:hypothetical protein
MNAAAKESVMNRADDSRFDVVWPLGRKAFAERDIEERVGDLAGKVIGELWDYVFRGEELYPILRAKLAERFPGIRFVTYDVFGNIHGPQQREVLAKLPELLREHKVDAVIASMGA